MAGLWKHGTKLELIEGIGPSKAGKLRKAGVRSLAALLEQGGTPEGRKAIAKATGIAPKLILEWVNHADLFRIKGVGEEYADLLEEAGVDTVVELAKRDPKVLFGKLGAANAAQKLVRRLPTQRQVGAWVRQAKKLPRRIRY
ncbi:MAG: ferredoxin [Chloroflexi bacterium RBG_13_68_17]|nr:MAG: ferredoxin [Chloroflexi bacterium RBG_13_68_17]